MSKIYLYLLSNIFLIIGILIASFHTNVFPQETGHNSRNVQDFATIEIISEPSSAQVFINQENRGMTPCTVDSLRPGTYSITLKLDNYKQFSEKITLGEGAYKKLLIQLSKVTGNLVIISSPENASIEMNGDTIGKTPFTSEDFKPGTYSISISKKNFKTYKTTVSVNEGKTNTEAVQLEPLFSITKIFSTPDKADVIINGANFGKTPFQCETLYPGPYEIIISKDGYQSKKITTNIQNESPNIISAKLILKEYADSLKQVKRKKFRNIRRIIFSSLSASFAVAGIISNYKVSKAQKEEDEAWGDYMQLNLTPSEYDELYNLYTNKVDETNRIINRRNVYFALAGISCIGLIISLPF